MRTACPIFSIIKFSIGIIFSAVAFFGCQSAIALDDDDHVSLAKFSQPASQQDDKNASQPEISSAESQEDDGDESNTKNNEEDEPQEEDDKPRSNEGSADLDAAFDEKINADSTRDLDKVVRLCESAIEKGLDADGEVQAKQLAASALYEHASQLSQRIFATQGQDKRWQKFRSDAVRRLEKAVEFQPEMSEAYVMMARLHTLPGGDRDQARKAIQKAVELAPEDREQLSNALFLRASLSEDKTSQISDLNQAIKINPKNKDAIRVRAVYYLQNNEPEKALQDLHEWLDAGEESTKNYLETAALLMALGPKFDEKLQGEAIKIVDQSIAHDPENPLPHTIRARINIIREKPEEAIQDATNALKLDPDNISVLILRATIHYDQENLDDALADVNRALEIEPLLVRGIQMRGLILSQLRKFDLAIEDIKLLADNEPSNQFLQRQLAMLYNAADRPSKAIPIYDRLVEMNSADQWEGKSQEKQHTIKSRRAAALRGRGDARLSTGEHKLAIDDYEEGLKLSEEVREQQEEENAESIPPDDGILNNLAWVLATSPIDELRDGERAIELATRAAEATEYKEAHILSTLASGYAETGDFENALKWIEKAIEVNRQAREDAPTPHNLEQQKSLQNEFESYQKNKPWREQQNVEEEPKEKETEEKEAESPADDEAEDPGDKPGDSTEDDEQEPEDESDDSESEPSPDESDSPENDPSVQ